MPRLIISIDAVVIKEVDVTQARTTIGRRPYNDIVIDSLAISGEHAVLHCTGGAVELEDLKSTNGSHIHGKAVTRQLLTSGDTIEMGKHRLLFLDTVDAALHHQGKADLQAMAALASAPPPAAAKQQHPPHPPKHQRREDTSAGAPVTLSMPSDPAVTSIPASLGYAALPVSASIQVISGNAAGREMTLTKVVTTIGKPGVAVASITRRHHGFVLMHLEGPDQTVLNGTAIGTTPLPLSSNDLIELAGTQMRFVQ